MLTVRVGKTKMARRPNFSAKLLLKYMLVLVSAAALLTLLLQNYSIPFKDELRRALSGDFQKSVPTARAPSKGPCDVVRDCPEDHFSFFVRSGAANVVAPKICLQNKLLNEEARKLIAELGSVSVKSLGFRDNWVFVGGKGASVHSNFEKYLKNDNAKNKYENWPELIEIQGCIPKYPE